MRSLKGMTPEEREVAQRQFECGQCMALAFVEVARLIEAASPDLTREGAAAIVRDWAETRRRTQ